MNTPSPTDRDREILLRIHRGGDQIAEPELRYQLDRKDQHPLALDPALLDALAELEQQGLIESCLHFRLTSAGEQHIPNPARKRANLQAAGYLPSWTPPSPRGASAPALDADINADPGGRRAA